MITASIIGAGSIGSSKPDELDSQGSKNTLTIANAMWKNPEIHLQNIVDIDVEKAKAAAEKWECAYNDPIDSDIVAVCVPETHHKEIIKSINPKLIIAEKPFCNSLADASDICRDNILVDYTRRFEPKHRELQQQLWRGDYGKILSCDIMYTRGLLRDGCHAIDLMNWFFGKCEDIKISNPGYYDDYVGDNTVELTAIYERCKHVHFTPMDSREYSVFDIRIMTSMGKIELVQNGQYIRFYHKESEKIYGNYDVLSMRFIETKTSLTNSLDHMIDNAVSFINKGEKLLCTAEDAIEVHKVIEKL